MQRKDDFERYNKEHRRARSNSQAMSLLDVADTFRTMIKMQPKLQHK